jgi:predicted CXXCH cytochrome family protein
MKTISKLASGLALVAISGATFAAGSGIASTRHNLGAGASALGNGGNNTDGTTEICVFCHTPHGANQSAAAPLWNRQFSTAGYNRYSALGTTTFDAAEAPVGSVSIACLSCHDGTQAMDAMINSPGSGSVSSGYTLSSITAGSSTGGNNWTESNRMSDLNASDNGNAGDLIYLGTDLRNDHPISMQYGGGGFSSAALSGPSVDAAYAIAGTAGAAGNNSSLGGTGRVANRTLGSGALVWYVDTNGGNGQQKDDFTLFSRTDGTGANAGLNQPYVECATCHDPHSTNTTFLRLSTGNAGSAVCLTCHTK